MGPPQESNEAHRAITTTFAGRAQQRSVVWYAAAAELRRAAVSLGGIAAVTILAVRGNVSEWAVGGIVAIATMASVRDVLGGRKNADAAAAPPNGAL